MVETVLSLSFNQIECGQNTGQSVSQDACKSQILTEVSRWMGMDPRSLCAFLQQKVLLSYLARCISQICIFPWLCELYFSVSQIRKSGENVGQFWQKSAGEWEWTLGPLKALSSSWLRPTFPWPCPLPLIVTHSDRNLDQNSDRN